MRAIRGNDISMIFQEPMTSLNPVMTIGRQIGEALMLHQEMSHKARAGKRAIEMLQLVGIPEPEQRVKEYPHQLSGGMRQRAMIAMALACNPKVLIADEPTSALDVTIQAQILDLIGKLQRELGTAVILITHDLGVVAETAERVIVMYAGRKVEEADRRGAVRAAAPPLHARADELDPAPRPHAARGRPRRRAAAGDPGHGAGAEQSAAGLHLRAALRLRRRHMPRAVSALRGEARRPLGRLLALRQAGGGRQWLRRRRPVLEVDGALEALSRAQGPAAPHRRPRLRRRRRELHDRRRARRWGWSARSGCGKTTVGRTILRLIEPTAGTIRLDGHDVTRLGKTEMRPFRRQMQIIFQDPFSSLNPRMRAGDIVGEPLKVHGIAARKDARRERVAALFERVGLARAQMDNFPHQFSGGQRQRIGVARALALNPKLIIGDEPVSALDVSIQAQVINLLMDLQRDLKLSYLFISHNLAVVEHIRHRIAVMYLGRIVEYTDKTTLFTRPLHPYTEALLAAVPVPDPAIKRTKLRGAGRRAEPAQAAARLPLPHALPLRRGALQGRGAGCCARSSPATTWRATCGDQRFRD